MSWMASNPIQVDPKKRICDLPPIIVDDRYQPSTLVYLTMMHNHAYDSFQSLDDLASLVQMADFHGIQRFGEDPVWISSAVFLARERGGEVECAGYYWYTLERPDEILRYDVDEKGAVTSRLAARVEQSAEGNIIVKAINP